MVYGLAGEYGTGKSMFAMQIAAAGKRAFYIDTENAFQPNVLDAIVHRFGLERWSDYIAVAQVYDVWQLIAYLRPDSDDYIPLDVPVIVDSLIGPFRPQFRGRERLALRQQTIGYLPDLLRRRAGGLGHLAMLTDQVMAVPEAYAAALKRPAGGDTFLHAVNALFIVPPLEAEGGGLYMAPRRARHVARGEDEI